MKRIIFAAVVLVGLAVWANRSDIWDASTVAMQSSLLIKRSDGGCAVQATAQMTKQDGGVTVESSRIVDLSGANRTACLDVLDKSLVLFKSDREL